jgi:hypothetical protein
MTLQFGECALAKQNRLPICTKKGDSLRVVLFEVVRPAGRTHLEVQVLCTPGKGKC